MKALCLQHVPFEGMAAIETWLVQHNFDISYTRFFESPVLPTVEEVDWVIIMGGPMSVNDEQEFPWLVAEKQFVKQCIEKGKVVLGICLGAQLIASSMGAKIYHNSQKEIGWFPIHKASNLKSQVFNNQPEELPVFHWHGETFDLPEDAELIASSEACRNQVFAIGNKTIGFQCHLETTAASLASIIANCQSELIPSTFIQTEKEMTEKEPVYSEEMHLHLYKILDNLLGL
jgi:GMP synthase - Glutamine amidotransferase domain